MGIICGWISSSVSSIPGGTPIAMIVKNEDQRPKDYGSSTMDKYPRPSHADWTYLEKYGVKASSGGGRSSARETIGRVAASAIAEKYLKLAHGIEIVAWVSSVGAVHMFPPTAKHPTPSTNPDFLALIDSITRNKVDEFVPVRCPDKAASEKMAEYIADFRDRKDSIGGTVTCVIRNVPSGLGEPVFDKIEAMLAHAMLSIPATKGIESSRRRQLSPLEGDIVVFVVVVDEALVNDARMTYFFPMSLGPSFDESSG